MKRPQSGFTLVEIAIVLVVIGLLLGGVLKGQELIASARVRNLSDQQAGIQAAYFGFMDRYRAVPGDMEIASAQVAIDESIELGTGEGESDGRLSAPDSGSPWSELNGVWEHLSKAGFIKGSFPEGDANDDSEPAAEDGPINVFNGNLVLARHSGYAKLNDASDTPRLVLHMGRYVPVDIARELDVKVDDGSPKTGTLRNAADASGNGTAYESGPDSECVENNDWNIGSNAEDCTPSYLF